MDKEQLEKHLIERFKGTRKGMKIDNLAVFPSLETGWPTEGERELACNVMLYTRVGGSIITDHLSEENIANAHLLANAYPLLLAAMKLQFLNGCEEEGISSGMPTPTDWREAFEELENVITKIIDYDKKKNITLHDCA